MVRFDEMLDGIISTTKNMAKAAGQKTTELVDLGKLKYQQQAITREIEKAYSKLGAIVYEAHVSDESLDGLVDMAIDEISDLNEKLDSIENDLIEASESFKKPVEPEAVHEDISITIPESDDIKEALEPLEVDFIKDSEEEPPIISVKEWEEGIQLNTEPQVEAEPEPEVEAEPEEEK